MKAVRISLSSAVLVLLAACSQVSLVPPGKTEIQGRFTVDNKTSWNRIAEGSRESWTKDGPLLQTLAFQVDIEEGENIFQREGAEDGPGSKYLNMPTYRKGMTEPEIGEMILASISQFGATNARSLGLNPAAFGGRSGFRMEIDYTDTDGLDKRMLVFGHNAGDRMHLIVYTAPNLHFFERDRPHVEEIVKSLVFKAT